MVKKILKPSAKGIATAIGKHSPEILTGIGIAGMLTTIVMAVRATPKALMFMEEEKERILEEDLADDEELEETSERSDTEASIKEIQLSPKEIVKTCWKCYIPTAITGTVSVICLIGASSVNMRQKAALATAYALSESALREYRGKVLETVGDKKEQAIRDAVVKEKVQKTPINSSEVIPTAKGDTLCLDYVSGRYFRSDIDTIRRAIDKLNRRLMDEMYVSLNDFYYEIGLPPSGLGDTLGWNIDQGRIDPMFSTQLAEDGTPCLVVGYLVAPRYDFATG